MKKLVLIGLGLLMYSNVYADGVYFTRDTLEASTTNYVLIDRNEDVYDVSGTTTSDTSEYFSHSSDNKYNMEINGHRGIMGSNIEQIKLGQIYDINASSASVRWFEMYYRKAADDSLLLDRDEKLYLDRENKNIKIQSSSESITTSDLLYIYDSNARVTPAKGDIILNVDATDTDGKISLYMEYEAK